MGAVSGRFGDDFMRALVFGLFAAASIFMASDAANAQSRYVDASSVNCRASASTSAAIVTRFTRNDTVTIVRRDGTWALIEHSPSCWISAEYLSSTLSFAPPVSAPRASSSRRRSSSGSSSSGRSSARGAYTAGTCPCSGSRVCIGPRGGRYCITSGGNRRYGV